MNCRRLSRAQILAMCALSLATTLACGPRDEPQAPSASAAPIPENSARPSVEARPRIVILGDSLTAGLGLPPEQAYPTLLQRRLNAEGLKYEIVNAGVSGDTSAGGLARLDWALDGDVRVLTVALGGNDALRGLPVDELTRNL